MGGYTIFKDNVCALLMGHGSFVEYSWTCNPNDRNGDGADVITRDVLCGMYFVRLRFHAKWINDIPAV